MEKKCGTQSYSRAIYEADYNYSDNNKDNELQVYVTYEIKLRNSSTYLQANVYNVQYYFDNRFDANDVVVGTTLDDNGNISDSNKKVVLNKDSNGNVIVNDVGNYKKVTIYLIGDESLEGQKGVRRIRAQSANYLYIRFKIGKDKVDGNTNAKDIQNVAEIKNYSVYSKNSEDTDIYTKIYAGIDKDSNPNNCTPGRENTYEDDTDYAPGLKITKAKARAIQGNVFEDVPDIKTNEKGTVREGNGLFDENEKGIRNIEVNLVDNDGNVVKVYKDGNWNSNATAITDKNGKYTISGFIPGDYKVQFTWGDKNYKVQEYKATIYKNISRQYKEDWYYKDSKRYTDAFDDYNIRQNIDEQMKVMDNKTKSIIMNEYSDKTELKENEYLITQMKSTTPEIKSKIEYSSKTISDGAEEEEQYLIENVDFGIVERPKQEIELNKRVSHIKLISPHQTSLVDTDIDKNGMPQEAIPFVQPASNNANNLVINADNEIIQGSTLKVTYKFIITNNSELDYNDENFYKYGIIPREGEEEKRVTLTPNSVIDYIDKNFPVDSFAEKEDTNWSKIQDKESVNTLISQGLINRDVKTRANALIDNNYTILKLDKEGKKLKPGESSDYVTLECSKLLGVKDETILPNIAEILKVTKSGGSVLTQTPGNYVPANSNNDESNSESDNSKAYEINITPNTGLKVDYVAYIVVVASSLGILIAGIILIKKYVISK